MKFYEKGQAGEGFHVEEFLGEDCKAHYDYLMTIPIMGDALRAVLAGGGSLPESQYDHIAFFKHGFLLFITYQPVPESHDIFKRFAKIFEQTYTRFLDLQKAETQAREAKIEAALEKVRSRSMGMQSSEELPEVANLMFLEIQTLDIHAWSCGYCILEEDRRSSTCIMSSEGTLQKPFLLPHYGEVSFEEWNNFVQSDETFFIQELKGKAIESHYDFMTSLPQLKSTFQELKSRIPCQATRSIIFASLHKASYSSFANRFRSSRNIQTVQTYSNKPIPAFLIKAEAQAREACIEAALNVNPELWHAKSRGIGGCCHRFVP